MTLDGLTFFISTGRDAVVTYDLLAAIMPTHKNLRRVRFHGFAPFLLVVAFSTISPNKGLAQAAYSPDQQTFDVVSNAVVGHPYPIVAGVPPFGVKINTLIKIISLTGSAITVALDEADAKPPMPNTIDEQIFEQTNCAPTPDEYKETIETTTTNTLTLTMSQSVQTSEDEKVNAGFSYSGFNYSDSSNTTSTWSMQSGSSQTISSVQTITHQVDYKVRPWSKLYVKVDIEKGHLQIPVVGTMVIDGQIIVDCEPIGCNPNTPVNISDILLQPKDRTVPLVGSILGETFVKTNVIRVDEDINANNDPDCKISVDPAIRRAHRAVYFDMPSSKHLKRVSSRDEQRVERLFLRQ